MSIEMVNHLVALIGSLLSIFVLLAGYKVSKQSERVSIVGNHNTVNIEGDTNVSKKFFTLVFTPTPKQVDKVKSNQSHDLKNENLKMIGFALALVAAGTFFHKYTLTLLTLIFAYFIYRYIRYIRMFIACKQSSYKVDINKHTLKLFAQLFQVSILVSLYVIPTPKEFEDVVSVVGFEFANLQSGLTTTFDWFIGVLYELRGASHVGLYFIARMAGMIIFVLSIGWTTSTNAESFFIRQDALIADRVKDIGGEALGIVLIVVLTLSMIYPWFTHDIYLYIEPIISDWLRS